MELYSQMCLKYGHTDYEVRLSKQDLSAGGEAVTYKDTAISLNPLSSELRERFVLVQIIHCIYWKKKLLERRVSSLFSSD